MCAQVAGNTLLCCMNKAETDFVTGQRGSGTQGERGGIKKRVQFAGLGIELMQTRDAVEAMMAMDTRVLSA